MDKQTLSHYGWIVVMVLTLSVMLAFATPLGKYVGKGVSNLAIAMGLVNDSAIKEDNIQNMGDDWEAFLDGNTGINELQEKHKFEYYSTINLAVNDVNAGTIGKNADVDKKDAVAGIYVENGNPYVVVLKDTTVSEAITPRVDMTINLGGKTINVNADVCFDIYSGNITVDAKLKGSKIINIRTDGGTARTIQARAGSISIYGGEYIAKTNRNSINTNILILADFTIKDAVITSENNGSAYGINIKEGGTGIIENCDIYVHGQNGVMGAVNCYDNTTIKKCKITAISDTVFWSSEEKMWTGAAAGVGINNGKTVNIYDTVINSSTVGVNGGGNMNIDNCNITASWICIHVMDNYTAHINNTTLRAEQKYNQIEACAIRADYMNSKTYINNSIIYTGIYSIVLGGGNERTNNKMYMSNTTIIGAKVININSDGDYLYIGTGCNFKKDDTGRPQNVIQTTDTYN